MTLRDLFSTYAADVPVNIVLNDKGRSAYFVRFNFENPDDYDLKIFETYSDARVLEWYVGNTLIMVLLDIERF